MGGSLSLYLAATPVVSRRRYSSSFASPFRYLRPRLHWPPFVGIKIGMVVELVPQLRPGSAPRVMLRLVRDGELVPHGVRFGLGTLEKPGLQGVH